jgi:hypothetical protein
VKAWSSIIFIRQLVTCRLECFSSVPISASSFWTARIDPAACAYTCCLTIRYLVWSNQKKSYFVLNQAPSQLSAIFSFYFVLQILLVNSISFKP